MPSVMVTIVVGVSSVTRISDVIAVTVKVWSPSNAPSSIIEMFTHLVAPSMDPAVKVSLEATLS